MNSYETRLNCLLSDFSALQNFESEAYIYLPDKFFSVNLDRLDIVLIRHLILNELKNISNLNSVKGAT